MAEHNEVGKWGEDIACDELVKLGFTVVERNWRIGKCEVDIIARRDSLFVFAEVKTRSDFDEDPLDAIDTRKIRNLVRAADAYLKAQALPAFGRFDLFSVRGNPEHFELEHIADAFSPSLKTY